MARHICGRGICEASQTPVGRRHGRTPRCGPMCYPRSAACAAAKRASRMAPSSWIRAGRFGCATCIPSSRHGLPTSRPSRKQNPSLSGMSENCPCFSVNGSAHQTRPSAFSVGMAYRVRPLDVGAPAWRVEEEHLLYICVASTRLSKWSSVRAEGRRRQRRRCLLRRHIPRATVVCSCLATLGSGRQDVGVC